MEPILNPGRLADNENYPGLCEALAAAGVAVEQNYPSGAWLTDKAGAAQAIVDAFDPLPWLQAKRLAEIDAKAYAQRAVITAGVSPAEMASWPIKRAEALAYAGSDASAPTLALEAQFRKVATAEIVDRVRANAIALLALEAQIAGISGKHKDYVSDAQRTVAELVAYDWQEGWPVA